MYGNFLGLYPFGEIFQDTQATDSEEIIITTPIVLFERIETSLYVSFIIVWPWYFHLLSPSDFFRFIIQEKYHFRTYMIIEILS